MAGEPWLQRREFWSPAVRRPFHPTISSWNGLGPLRPATKQPLVLSAEVRCASALS
jgi:hypothetical protein